MQEKREIPCASCRLWDTKNRSFSCKPHDCPELNAWLLENAPQIMTEKVHVQVQLPETAIQYVV